MILSLFFIFILNKIIHIINIEIRLYNPKFPIHFNTILVFDVIFIVCPIEVRKNSFIRKEQSYDLIRPERYSDQRKNFAS